MLKRSVIRWLKSHRVAVLKGGWSCERPISLKTGAAVERAFAHMGIRVQGIDVGRDIAAQLKKRQIQFCFIALHGTFGEDGGVQTLLEFLRIPYTGSGPFASALAMDKDLSKKIFVHERIPTPKWMCVTKYDSIGPLKRWLRHHPLFVKPYDQGSAIGASRIDRAQQLPRALRACFKVSTRALVEKFVEGRELTVSVLGRVALPVVEIIPEHSFYDFHSKYAAGGSRHIAPADLPAKVTTLVQQTALRAHDALGCTVYGRVDLILEKEGAVTVLEANTIPGMTRTSLLPDAARAAGIGFDALVLRVCELSLKRNQL